MADFIGRANFLEAKIVAQDAVSTELELIAGARVVVKHPFDFAVGERVRLVVRPEAIDLVTPEEGLLVGRIILVQLTGASAHYRIALSSQETVDVEILGALEKGILSPGTLVGLRLHSRNLWVLRDEL